MSFSFVLPFLSCEIGTHCVMSGAMPENIELLLTPQTPTEKALFSMANTINHSPKLKWRLRKSLTWTTPWWLFLNGIFNQHSNKSISEFSDSLDNSGDLVTGPPVAGAERQRPLLPSHYPRLSFLPAGFASSYYILPVSYKHLSL